MMGEYELIQVSKYRYLVDFLNGLHTFHKLTQRNVDPIHITFHDQVLGSIGWNIFIADAKFNLGAFNYHNNQLIICYTRTNYLMEQVKKILEENHIDYEINDKIATFTVVAKINYLIDETNIHPIIDLIKLNIETRM